MTERHAVICRPTDSYAAPVSGSVREHCYVCAEEVWLSPASRAAAGGEPLILCIDCAPGVIRTEAQPKLLRPTPAQLAELRAHRRDRT